MKVKGDKKANKLLLVQWFCPYVFLGKKIEKRSLTIITMMNMCDNEFKIENVFLTEETFFQMWYQMKPTSESLSLTHPTNLKTNKGCVTL